MSENPNHVLIDDTEHAQSQPPEMAVKVDLPKTDDFELKPSSSPIDSDNEEAPWGYKADGTPRKRPGRPRKDGDNSMHDRLESVTQAPPRRPKEKPIETASVIAHDYEAAARVAANAWFSVGTLLLGDDWAPDTAANEHLHVKTAFKDYFVEAQVGKIPPSAALLLVLVSYAAIRAPKPTIRQRITQVVTWIKSLKR
jgi:hypothetical protein